MLRGFNRARLKQWVTGYRRRIGDCSSCRIDMELQFDVPLNARGLRQRRILWGDKLTELISFGIQ